MIRLSEDPKYGFAVGRVRALEPYLLDRPRYERLIRSRGGEDFAAVLAETVYARFIEGGAARVGAALERAAEDNVAFLSAYALDQWLLHLFSLPAAFRRLKTRVKSDLARGKVDPGPTDELDAMGSELPVAPTVAAAVQAFHKDRDPAAVDMALDRLLQEVELRVARPSEFLSRYFALHADLENLRTLTRVKAKESPGQDAAGEMASAFLEGGALTISHLVTALPQPWEAILDRLAKAPPFGVGGEEFREYLERGRSAVSDRRSFVKMERIGREKELHYLRQTRYATFGHEPVAAFFLLHENELRNLRLLYAAKLSGLAVDETQDLVAYVE